MSDDDERVLRAGPEERRAPTRNELEVRLPRALDYAPVLRAIVGVLAGNASFNYDEIVHLRVVMSEVLALATRPSQGEDRVDTGLLTVRFRLDSDQLEIEVAGLDDRTGRSEDAATAESRAVLESLMDTVEFDTGPDGGSVLRLLKRNPAA